jgi:hypothetical protein
VGVLESEIRRKRKRKTEIWRACLWVVWLRQKCRRLRKKHRRQKVKGKKVFVWNLTCFTIRQKKLTLRANVVTKIWSSDLDHQFSGASCTFYLLHLSFLWNLEISSIFSLSWIWLL